MVEARACIYFSVFFLCFYLAAGKPFFGFLYCDLMCDDDDDTTTIAGTQDPWDIILCEGCGTRRPPTTPPNPMQFNPVNLLIPGSSNPMNLTWFPGINGFSVNMVPWNQGMATPFPIGTPANNAPNPTAAPPVANTAAPAATTAAPAAAATPAA